MRFTTAIDGIHDIFLPNYDIIIVEIYIRRTSQNLQLGRDRLSTLMLKSSFRGRPHYPINQELHIAELMALGS